MSSLDRTISGEVLVRHLPRDEQTIDQSLVARHGRSARTLVKEGPLRLTVMALAPSGGLPAHNTDGPVSIHVLEGDVVFEALGQKYPLSVGDVLVLAAGVEHSASSARGCVFLLTVVHGPLAAARG
jgi:quercetin dioxygenase-like cupin family protein